jgi:hypothetical protein
MTGLVPAIHAVPLRNGKTLKQEDHSAGVGRASWRGRLQQARA